MLNDTQLIVITSNDDLIRKISSNHWSKTNIIDLDENPSESIPLNQNKSTVAQISPSDLNIFFELSHLNNANNDQVYHDQLNSSRNLRSKSLKMTRKSSNYQCLICDDRAIGYNYDVLSCASCKAFFRRNAHHSIENLRCLTGRNDCSIRSSDRRKCQRCRLEKCFQMGMRKDFILTDDEKQRRREKSQNNSLNNTTNDRSTSNSIEQESTEMNDCSSIERWIEVEMVRTSYTSIFPSNEMCTNRWNFSDRASAFASWSDMASQVAMKLIEYFRQIDQFEYLNQDDRFFLIKSNLLPIFYLHKSQIYNHQTNSFVDVSEEESYRRQQFFNLCYGKVTLREDFLSLIRRLSELTEQDVTLTSLLLIILLFSKGISMIDDEGILKDSLTVHQYQNHFLQLMIHYLIEKKGFEQSTKQVMNLLLQISQIQQITRRFRQFFHSQLQSDEILQRIAPLMKTVLNIS